MRHLPAVKRPVIAGLGMTAMTRDGSSTAPELAVAAVHAAVADAGLSTTELDGLLTSSGVTGDVDRRIAPLLGLRDRRLQSEIYASGASAGAMVQYAALAVASGMASAVVCVFGDAPLRSGAGGGAAFAAAQAAFGGDTGFGALPAASGMQGAKSGYAMATRRHMHRFGTTSEQLGAVAVAARQWAELNPAAQQRKPLTLADHQASRMIVDPLRMLDCCLVTNGAVAVVVTTAERAVVQPPVHLHGFAQAHPGYAQERGSDFGIVSGAAASGRAALGMAGLSLRDVEFAELYDCFTFTTLISLEDYGFCEKGEGGPFVASGAIAPAGSLPVNTGGGQLSGYYMWGMTPLSEAILQIRGQAGERQVDRRDVALVSGNGGVLDHHSTLILGREAL